MSEAGMHHSDLNGGPVQWISKSEAARLLDKKERTILNMCSSGKLRSKQERDTTKGGQKVTLVHAGDVARWAQMGPILGGVEFTNGGPQEQSVQLVRNGESVYHPGSSIVVDVTNGGGSAALDLRGVRLSPRPWLTLGEAAEYSGLPKSCILALIEASQLKAIDCGPRPGGRYRVKRVDLDALEGMNL